MTVRTTAILGLYTLVFDITQPPVLRGQSHMVQLCVCEPFVPIAGSRILVVSRMSFEACHKHHSIQ